MTHFNSLGSNYTVDFVIKALLTLNRRKYITELQELLKKKYQGEVTLLYKGREALELALRLTDTPKGCKVVINGFTCYAVYKAIENAGYKVVYADVEDDLNFSPETLEKLLQNNPTVKVVIIQNTLGIPCHIKEIETLCKKNSIILIEDLAHSAGSTYEDGREAGTVGDFTVLSFSQDKMIDSVSGGALIVRNNKYFNKTIPQLKNVSYVQQLKDRLYPLLTLLIRKSYQTGMGKMFHYTLRKFHLLSRPMAGGKVGELRQLPGWYCHLATSQFENLYGNLTHRREITLQYSREIEKDILSIQAIEQMKQGANVRFFIRVPDRQSLLKYLKPFGVNVADIWYDAPIAPVSYLSRTTYDHNCPRAEKITETIVNLPTHRGMTALSVSRIARKVNIWYQSQLKK